MTPRGLRIFNACVAVLQVATGVAIFCATDRNAKLPWYTDFVYSQQRNAPPPGFFYPVAKQVASLPIGWYSGTCTSMRFTPNRCNTFSVKAFFSC